MRTKTLLLTAALSVAGIATSMAQAVYSVNAVGYVNTDLVPGFNMISNPLDNKSSANGNTIANLFTTGFQGAIPNALTVYHFDPATDQFVSTGYDDLDQAFSGAVANQVIPPGTGMFVFLPGSTTRRITFVGEVPQAAASNQQLPQGFSIKASTVPIGGLVTSMQFPSGQADTIYEWDKTAQQYVSASYDDLDGTWVRNGQPAVPNIDVGEAFFLFKVQAAAWNRNFTVNQ
jgi:hypothetical protein